LAKSNIYIIFFIFNIYFINIINFNSAISLELIDENTFVDSTNSTNSTNNQNQIRYKNSFLFSIGREIIYNDNNFYQLPDVSSCCDGNFDNGIGKAFNLSLGGKIYLDNLLFEEIGLNSTIFLITKLGLSSADVELRREQATLLNFDDELLDGKFEHLANFKYVYYYVDFNVQTELFYNFNFTTGIELGKINTLNFSQIERIIEPVDRGVFINDKNDPNYDPKNDFKRSRNEVSKTLNSNTNILVYYNIGLGYKLPFFEKLFDNYLEVNYQHGFSNIIDKINWTNNRILINYVINFDFFK